MCVCIFFCFGSRKKKGGQTKSLFVCSKPTESRPKKEMNLKNCVVVVAFQYHLILTAIVPLSDAFSATTDSSSSSSVYWNQYSAARDLDQAAFESGLFWSDIDANIPDWRTAPALARFRGFCDNLKSETPGKVLELPNGQQLLAQYFYPGLSDHDRKDDSIPDRRPYPTEDYAELRKLREKLERKVAPVGQRELEKLLEARPLISDDAGTETIGEDGDTWQRAAWYGWQYLSLRGAQKFMPKTAIALRKAMGGSGSLGPAHRFVGLARQKKQCKGVVHSDERNYMLSTLTPIAAPKNCGIIVGGIDAPLVTGGSPVILDNTFPHYVYNDSDEDRFCLMSECWHPALNSMERDALATLFAVKDRFTVLELRLAPWGYDDDDLGAALKSGAVNELDYWKEIGFDHSKASKTKGKKKNAAKAKGFARA